MSSGTTTGGNSGTSQPVTAGGNLIIEPGDGINLVTNAGAGPNGEDVIVVSINEDELPEVQGTALVAGNGIDLIFDQETNTYTVTNECCDVNIVGTMGCEFPDNPSNGDVHYNGGDSGWTTVWNGQDWIRTCFGVGTQMLMTSTDDGSVTALEVTACDLAAGTMSVGVGTVGLITINGVPGDAAGDFDICALDAVDPTADPLLSKFLVCEDGVAKAATAGDIINIMIQNPVWMQTLAAAMLSADPLNSLRLGDGNAGSDLLFYENDGV